MRTAAALFQMSRKSTLEVTGATAHKQRGRSDSLLHMLKPYALEFLPKIRQTSAWKQNKILNYYFQPTKIQNLNRYQGLPSPISLMSRVVLVQVSSERHRQRASAHRSAEKMTSTVAIAFMKFYMT